MIRRPPRSTHTNTLFPYTPLFRSGLPLSLAAPYLPERSDGRPWVLRGEIAIDGRLRPVGNAWQGDVTVTAADGGLRLSPHARRDVIGYSNLSLAAAFNPQRIEATPTIASNGRSEQRRLGKECVRTVTSRR